MGIHHYTEEHFLNLKKQQFHSCNVEWIELDGFSTVLFLVVVSLAPFLHDWHTSEKTFCRHKHAAFQLLRKADVCGWSLTVSLHVVWLQVHLICIEF